MIAKPKRTNFTLPKTEKPIPKSFNNVQQDASARVLDVFKQLVFQIPHLKETIQQIFNRKFSLAKDETMVRVGDQPNLFTCGADKNEPWWTEEVIEEVVFSDEILHHCHPNMMTTQCESKGTSTELIDIEDLLYLDDWISKKCETDLKIIAANNSIEDESYLFHYQSPSEGFIDKIQSIASNVTSCNNLQNLNLQDDLWLQLPTTKRILETITYQLDIFSSVDVARKFITNFKSKLDHSISDLVELLNLYAQIGCTINVAYYKKLFQSPILKEALLQAIIQLERKLDEREKLVSKKIDDMFSNNTLFILNSQMVFFRPSSVGNTPLPDIQMIANMIANKYGRDTFTLYFDNCCIPLLQSWSLSGLCLVSDGEICLDVEVDLSFCEIERIESFAFCGSTMKGLSLEGNKLGTLVKNSFAGLTITSSLELNDCEISAIEPGAFNQLVVGARVDLSRNKLSILKSGTFGGLKASTIFLKNNKCLTTIEPNAFAGSWIRKIVGFGLDKVEMIMPMAFAGMPLLTEIDFNSSNPETINYFKSLKLDILDPLLYRISQDPILNDEVKINYSSYSDKGCRIDIDMTELINHYITFKQKAIQLTLAENNALGLVRKYTLQLLLCDELQEPEAIKFLIQDIYNNTIVLEDILPTKSLHWVCEQFSRYHMNLFNYLVCHVDYLIQNSLVDELTKTIPSIQLITPPLTRDLSNQALEELKETLLRYMPEGLKQQDHFNAIAIGFTRDGGIVTQVNARINAKIGVLLSKYDVQVNYQNDNQNHLRAVVKSTTLIPESRRARIRTVLFNLIGEVTDYDSIVETLVAINPKEWQTKFVNDCCSKLLGTIDPGVPQKIIADYGDWSLVLKQRTEDLLQELMREFMKEIVVFESQTNIYSAFIMNFLPFLSCNDMMAIINTGLLTEVANDQINIIIKYSQDSSNDAKELLKCVPISASQFISIQDLRCLHPDAVEEILDNLTLITLQSDNEQTLYSSSPINNLNALQAIKHKLPLWLVNLIGSKFSVTNVVAEFATDAVLVTLNEDGITLTSEQSEILCSSIYSEFKTPMKDHNMATENKMKILQACKDQGLDYTEFGESDIIYFSSQFAEIRQIESINQRLSADKLDYKGLLELQTMLKEHLMSKHYFIKLEQLGINLHKQFKEIKSLEDTKLYELYFLLSASFANLSSTSGFGIHDAKQNIAFQRLRLYAVIFLILCVDNGKNFLNLQQQSGLCEEIKNFFTRECGGQIANRLSGNCRNEAFATINTRIRQIQNTLIKLSVK